MANASESLGWDVGEYSSNARLEEVEYGGTNITYSPGDLIKFTGINAAGQMIAEKVSGIETPRGVVAKGQGGKSGDIKAVVVQGDVVALCGTAITAGDGLKVKGGKFVASGTGSSSPGTFGFSRAVVAADGDYGLVCFISY